MSPVSREPGCNINESNGCILEAIENKTDNFVLEGLLAREATQRIFDILFKVHLDNCIVLGKAGVWRLKGTQ